MPRATDFLGANCINVRDVQDFDGDEFVGVVKSVEARTMGDRQKLIVYFEDMPKGLALNQENLEAMIALAGGEDDTDRWAGLSVRVYIDPNVVYMGRRVGGIRVSEPESPPAKAKAK